VNQKQHPSGCPHRFARIPRIRRLLHLKPVETDSTSSESRLLASPHPHRNQTNMPSCPNQYPTSETGVKQSIWSQGLRHSRASSPIRLPFCLPSLRTVSVNLTSSASSRVRRTNNLCHWPQSAPSTSARRFSITKTESKSPPSDSDS